MSNWVLYHGSNHSIKKPKLELGKKTNDYGIGFYMTQDIYLANEWAVKNNNDGVLNEYKCSYDDLKVLDLLNGKFNVLNWIAILLNNRDFNITDDLSLEAKKYIIDNFLIDINDYDVVVGYRADDSYFSYAQSFINGTLSIESLCKALFLGNLGIQIVFISEKAINKLELIGSYYVSKDEYYQAYKKRDDKARNDYKNSIKNKSNIKTDTFIIDLIRLEMKNNDKRLQKYILK
ncbi:MAG: DUF3990 domain-containing protein [bacterium]|nr:DUF3990 domain-containing protein [bacterium]